MLRDQKLATGTVENRMTALHFFFKKVLKRYDTHVHMVMTRLTELSSHLQSHLLDQAGAAVETEEEVDTDALPAPARAALQKRAAGGTILKVEKVTAGNIVSYEGTIKGKSGKTTEYAVTAAGKPKKD
jgi:hypothetical protein